MESGKIMPLVSKDRTGLTARLLPLNRPHRRLAIRGGSTPTCCRLPVGETAGCQPALPADRVGHVAPRAPFRSWETYGRRARWDAPHLYGSWKWGLLLFLVLAAALGTGCQTVSYYGQAIRGQCEILSQREPIARLLADPKSPESLKEKLRLILKLREFAAEELKLPVDGHYERYADVHRRFVVWNVHGAPEFSLKPKSWWYPVVGRLKYRGYFSETQARRYARRLKEEEGLDVYVAGVEAYSTLGWFKDPVLNTFMHHEEANLAEILIHELAHQRLFVRGDTDFDEAFATAVAEEGVGRWLRARGDKSTLEKFQIEQERQAQFVRLVLDTRARLQSVYGDKDSVERHSSPQPSPPSAGGEGEKPGAPSLCPLERWRQKEAILSRLREDYERLKAQWGGYSGFDHWFAQPLNNAQLNTVETYYQLVPGFRRLLRASEGDLPKFYRQVAALGRWPKEERRRRLGSP
jgi:predicted aminopeptidase